jgi:glycosyltransferase involved in cell wall biosynthesis
MKVLIISSIGYEGGGAEQGIVLIAQALRASGNEVCVVTSDLDASRPHTVSDIEFRACSNYPFWQRAVSRVFNWSAYATVKRVLQEFKPDVIQVHTTFEVSPAVLFLCRTYPAVLVVHGAEDYTKELLLWGFPTRFFRSDADIPSYRALTWEGKAHYWYHRCISIPVYVRALVGIERVLVVSEYMQRMLLKQGIASVCIPNATVLPEPVALNPKSLTLLYAGRLERLKGVQYLLEALPVVRREIPGVRLVVAGTGTYTEALQACAQTLGVADVVEWVGHVDQRVLYDLYAQSAVVVVPSIWPEPFGKVGIEAMGVGRPVVASDVGGIREWLLNGVTGYVVPPCDAGALSEKIIDLLSDAELRIRMGTAGCDYAQKFSLDTFIGALTALHQECIRANNSKA